MTSYSTEEETENSPLGQWKYFLMPIRGLDNSQIKSRLGCDLLNPFRLVLGPNQPHVLGLSAFAKVHRLKRLCSNTTTLPLHLHGQLQSAM